MQFSFSTPQTKCDIILVRIPIININVDLQIYTHLYTLPIPIYEASETYRMINLFWFNRFFQHNFDIVERTRCLVLHPFDVMHNHEVMFVYLLIHKYLYGLTVDWNGFGRYTAYSIVYCFSAPYNMLLCYFTFTRSQILMIYISINY